MSLHVHLSQTLGNFSMSARFDAPPGITVLFGRSGSGKTSILRAIAGLSTGGTGRIALNDRVLFDASLGLWVPPHRRRMGVVFQDARLFPHLSVQGNLTYGTRFGPTMPRAEQTRIIDMLGIGPLLRRRAGALSGGERQRIALGRALLSSPDILLADEPLSALDAQRKAEILPYFERLRDETGIPVLYVSHAVDEVARLATTVVALDQGRVIAQGGPAQVLGNPDIAPNGPADLGALLDTVVDAHLADGLTRLTAQDHALYLPRLPLPTGHRVRVRIAAQDVILSRDAPMGLSALNILPGTVTDIRSTDPARAVVTITTPAGPVLSRVTQRSVKALGLTQGCSCHAIAKTVAIATDD